MPSIASDNARNLFRFVVTGHYPHYHRAAVHAIMQKTVFGPIDLSKEIPKKGKFQHRRMGSEVKKLPDEDLLPVLAREVSFTGSGIGIICRIDLDRRLDLNHSRGLQEGHRS